MTIAAISSCLNLCCLSYRPSDKVTTLAELCEELKNSDYKTIMLKPFQRIVIKNLDVKDILSQYRKDSEKFYFYSDISIPPDYGISVLAEDFAIKSIRLFSGKEALAMSSSQTWFLELVAKTETLENLVKIRQA